MLPPNMTEPNETPKYTCALTNLLGKENELVRILQDRSFVEGKNVILFCRVLGSKQELSRKQKTDGAPAAKKVEIVTDV